LLVGTTQALFVQCRETISSIKLTALEIALLVAEKVKTKHRSASPEINKGGITQFLGGLYANT